jgi:hypothetical protein
MLDGAAFALRMGLGGAGAVCRIALLRGVVLPAWAQRRGSPPGGADGTGARAGRFMMPRAKRATQARAGCKAAASAALALAADLLRVARRGWAGGRQRREQSEPPYRPCGSSGGETLHPNRSEG